MRAFIKLSIMFLFLAILVPLWLIGFHSIKSAIEQGRFPMYEMAVWFNLPEWAPLTVAIIIFAIMYYCIAWRGIVSPLIKGGKD